MSYSKDKWMSEALPILQVFHGGDLDIQWLQRDFGVYVVNMFDTGQASRVLNFPRFSLAYLLKFYCDVDADKQYQLADWRIRWVLIIVSVFSLWCMIACTCAVEKTISRDDSMPLVIGFQTAARRADQVCSGRYAFPALHLPQDEERTDRERKQSEQPAVVNDSTKYTTMCTGMHINREFTCASSKIFLLKCFICFSVVCRDTKSQECEKTLTKNCS